MEQVFCFNNKIKLRILFSFNSQFNLNELIGLQFSIRIGPDISGRRQSCLIPTQYLKLERKKNNFK